MADKHGVALHFDSTGGDFQQLGQALGLELAQGEAEVGELLGVGHAPYPVDAFHQAVLFDHRGAVDVFDGEKRSLMILNTVLKPGSVNTLMTMPRTPGP